MFEIDVGLATVADKILDVHCIGPICDKGIHSTRGCSGRGCKKKPTFIAIPSAKHCVLKPFNFVHKFYCIAIAKKVDFHSRSDSFIGAAMHSTTALWSKKP